MGAGSWTTVGGCSGATFVEVAVGEPEVVDGITRDTAWVRYDEGEHDGTTKKWPLSALHPRNPDDNG